MSETGNITQNDFIKKEDLVSHELLTVFITTNLILLAGPIGLVGIVTNVLNIVIFFRQGLNDTVNIGLLALAVSDLCSLVTLEWECVLNNQLFIYNVPFITDEVQHLSAAWPHACFARITSWITVYITMERCLCVVIPLKIKRVITPKVTVCVVVCIFVVMFLSLVPEYATCYIDWKFVPEQNRSMLGLLFLPGRDQVAALSFMFAAGTQITSFGALIVLTVILVVKIQQKSKWRKASSNSGNNSSMENNTRDKKTVTMITLVAVIYCVCFLPMLCTFIATSIEKKLIIFGSYNNTFILLCSFIFLFDSINSSVNIFVYYRMSTKYRTMFDSLFSRNNEATRK